jgi:hypothetical protein
VTALPLENARPYFACSRAAIAVSRRSLVSFPEREYSYFEVPISDWVKVVLRPMGGITAFVDGSG